MKGSRKNLQNLVGKETIKCSPKEISNYMCNLHGENRRKAYEIDLLSSHKITQKWLPQFLRRNNHWKAFSGKWEFDSTRQVIYLTDPKPKTGEDTLIVGSPSCHEFIFHVKFKILAESIKPPEGGTILYSLFKDIKNYYSFHFCLFKQKIEFIKRFQGDWTILAENQCNFELQKYYSITISANSGVHQCQIDGQKLLETTDNDISQGCVGIGGKFCEIEFSHVSLRRH